MLESSGALNGPRAPGHTHVAGGRGGRRLIVYFFRRRCSCRRSAGGAWWTSALGWAAAPCSCTTCRRWPPATSTSRWAAAFCAQSCPLRVVLRIELHFRTPPVIPMRRSAGVTCVLSGDSAPSLSFCATIVSFRLCKHLLTMLHCSVGASSQRPLRHGAGDLELGNVADGPPVAAG